MIPFCSALLKLKKITSIFSLPIFSCSLWMVPVICNSSLYPRFMPFIHRLNAIVVHLSFSALRASLKTPIWLSNVLFHTITQFLFRTKFHWGEQRATKFSKDHIPTVCEPGCHRWSHYIFYVNFIMVATVLATIDITMGMPVLFNVVDMSD